MTTLNDHKARAHALLSASSSARWLACPPSAVAAEMYAQQETDYTREGTLAHEVAELVAGCRDKGGSVSKQQLKELGADTEMVACAEAYADYIQEQIHSDDALVLLEQRVDFSPWVPDGFGTADCIIIQGDTMDVIDYKYGKGVTVSATDNPQEKLYGLGALNDYGFAYSVKQVRLHIFQPRLNNVSVDGLSTAELLDWGEKTVAPTAAKAAKGEGDYTAGEHCRFCLHAGRCRALAQRCTEYITLKDMEVGVPVMAEWEVAEALTIEPLVSLWFKRVRERALTSMLSGEHVPGFKVVQGKAGNRKWTDEALVLTTLSEAGYSAEDVTETKLLSPSAMDKALGKKKAAELLAGLTDRAPGSPTIAPENDKRPAYDPAAETLKELNTEKRSFYNVY